MAIKDVQIKRYNGSGWDEINPKTKGSLVSYNGSSTSVAGTVDKAIYDLEQNKINVSEKGAAGGVATLDSNAKVLLSQLPDSILGNLTFGGTLFNDGGVPMVAFSTEAKAILGRRLSGVTIPDRVAVVNTKSSQTSGGQLQQLGYGDAANLYFICGANPSAEEFEPVTFAGKTFESGDWLLSTGEQWTKVDNNDAVTSVNGQVGAVVLTGNDIKMNGSDATKLDVAINTKITNPTGGSTGDVLTKTADGVKWSAADGNTWRPIYVNESQLLSNNTSSGYINFKNGNGITLTTTTGASSSGLTITLKKAGVESLGGVTVYKVNSDEVSDNTPTTEVAGRYYGLRVDKDGEAYTNVPWKDMAVPLQKTQPTFTGVDLYEGRIWYEDLN